MTAELTTRLHAMRTQALALVAALLVGLPAPAASQSVRAVSLAFDNDGFNFWIPPRQRTDWFYTHGTRLDFVLMARPPAAGLFGVEALPVCGAEATTNAGRPAGECLVTHFRLSQQIYTPENLFGYVPQNLFGTYPRTTDRPYAGWLSMRVGAERVSPSRNRFIGVEIGVTGRASLGGQAHLMIHRWLDKADPVGWEYQIPFEVAAAVTIRNRAVWPASAAARGLSLSILPSWQATLGSLRTSGGVGMGLRLGWNSPPGAEWRTRSRDDGPVWGLATIGFDAEAVAYDLFLDGSLWHETVSTAREPVIARARAGIEVGFRGLGLQFGVTRSTPAFTAQKEGHTYGTLGLRVLR